MEFSLSFSFSISSIDGSELRANELYWVRGRKGDRDIIIDTLKKGERNDETNR